MLRVFAILSVVLLVFINDSDCQIQPQPAMPPMPEPEFAEEIKNASVSVGRKVTLSCVVNNLGNYRVAWLYVEKYTLLTLAKTVITHSNRFKVTHNGHRTWNLVISDVQEKDKGAYMCQINTSPMKFQVGYLDVVVPPRIKEELMSADTEVKEGSDVSLFCAADGIPEPTLQWRREDMTDIQIDDYKTAVVKGAWLNITKVSRLHMGAYLCIAQNTIQPSVSRRVKLDVQFPPMIWLTDQLLGKSVGSNVRMKCNLEAHPRGTAYWTRNGDPLKNGSRFVEEVQQLTSYKHAITLDIKNLEPEDFGEYHCIAKNSLGETEGTVKVFEVAPTTTTTLRPRLTSRPGTTKTPRYKTRNKAVQERTKPPNYVFNSATDNSINEIYSPNERVNSGYNISAAFPLGRLSAVQLVALIFAISIASCLLIKL